MSQRRGAPRGIAVLVGAAAVCASAIGLACASAGAPPGGPEDHDPPVLLSTVPDSGQVNVRVNEINFLFDETVNDKPSGAASLDQLFLISPRNGDVDVSWHRSRISVHPSRGFRPNTAYRITLLPGIADLRGNVRKEPDVILFSTGPTFPPFGILGRVFDWNAQRPAPSAYVEAISHPDTSVVYVGAADSVGQFDIGPLPAGTYTVRGIIDVNHNRLLDRNEKWDTATVTVATTQATVELDAIERDSIAANFEDIRPIDSVTIRVSFDKPLDPAIVLQPALIRLQRADSTELVVSKVEWAAPFDRERARLDSIKRAEVADSIRRADTSAARRAAPPAAPVARPPVNAPPVPGGPRAAPPPPKPKAPPPDRAIVVTLAPTNPLVVSQTYRITARGIRNLEGKSREITRSFTMPKPAPKDTTHKTPADSARRPPAAPPPRRPPSLESVLPALHSPARGVP